MRLKAIVTVAAQLGIALSVNAMEPSPDGRYIAIFACQEEPPPTTMQAGTQPATSPILSIDDHPSFRPDFAKIEEERHREEQASFRKALKNPAALWLWDVKNKEARRLALKPGWAPQDVCWVGEDLCVMCLAPMKDEVGAVLARVSIQNGDVLNQREFDEPVFMMPVSVDGRAHLLLWTWSLFGSDAGDVYRLPDFKKVKEHFARPEPMLWGWAWRLESPQTATQPATAVSKWDEDQEAADMLIVDPKGKVVSRVPGKNRWVNIPGISGDSGTNIPDWAVTSADLKTILLVIQHGLAYGSQHSKFGVIDAASGKLLWSYCGIFDYFGTPIVTEKEVWAIQPEYELVQGKEPSRSFRREIPGKLSLVRYQNDPNSAQVPIECRTGAKCEVIAKITAAEGHSVISVLAGIDGKAFFVHVQKRTEHQLMIVPVKNDLKQEEVTVSPLRDATTSRPAD